MRIVHPEHRGFVPKSPSPTECTGPRRGVQGNVVEENTAVGGGGNERFFGYGRGGPDKRSQRQKLFHTEMLAREAWGLGAPVRAYTGWKSTPWANCVRAVAELYKPEMRPIIIISPLLATATLLCGAVAFDRPDRSGSYSAKFQLISGDCGEIDDLPVEIIDRLPTDCLIMDSAPAGQPARCDIADYVSAVIGRDEYNIGFGACGTSDSDVAGGGDVTPDDGGRMVGEAELSRLNCAGAGERVCAGKYRMTLTRSENP